MRSWIIAASLLLSLSCQDLRDGYEKGFKNAFYKRFVSSCKEGAAKTGSVDLRAAYCECLGKELTQKYSSAQLKKITLAGKSQEMDEAARVCSGK